MKKVLRKKIIIWSIFIFICFIARFTHTICIFTVIFFLYDLSIWTLIQKRYRELIQFQEKKCLIEKEKINCESTCESYEDLMGLEEIYDKSVVIRYELLKKYKCYLTKEQIKYVQKIMRNRKSSRE